MSAATSTLHGSTFRAMGTVVSMASPEALPPTLLRAVEDEFARFEARFSMHRPDSEASRVSRGELAVRDASDEYRSALQEAFDWQQATDGAFTPFSPDGELDLSGIVKALAIRASGALLADVPDWCVNAGGDALVAGRAIDGRPWAAGIVDPFDRQALLTKCVLDRRRAIATSGVAERGEHVWCTDDTFAQVTVVADDVITADVLATAVLAGGEPMLHHCAERWSVDLLAIARDGSMHATDLFRR
ncbi:FAD:protein FMN transferase [uncultured Tessaracoccus sp.]|uniref:FAD:protein FMN transferase n=1 Tax=uncultured Tessaracoccus sp. TaxID=905023 RepID=UPI0025F54571|nr:FAD:protein FMN transferase [uncultured Tessaracoccus sp.]